MNIFSQEPLLHFTDEEKCNDSTVLFESGVATLGFGTGQVRIRTRRWISAGNRLSYRLRTDRVWFVQTGPCGSTIINETCLPKMQDERQGLRGRIRRCPTSNSSNWTWIRWTILPWSWSWSDLDKKQAACSQNWTLHRVGQGNSVLESMVESQVWAFNDEASESTKTFTHFQFEVSKQNKTK